MFGRPSCLKLIIVQFKHPFSNGRSSSSSLVEILIRTKTDCPGFPSSLFASVVGVNVSLPSELSVPNYCIKYTI